MLATCIRHELVISGCFTVGNHLLLKHTFPIAKKKTVSQVQRLNRDGNPRREPQIDYTLHDVDVCMSA